MPFDYSSADRILELSFGKLDRPSARMDFPKPGTLSNEITALIETKATTLVLTHNKIQLIASASVEMWHRAIHSFLWSVALTDTSPMWASISGYYASHFVMRAFAHSMGFWRSFKKRKVVQIIMIKGDGQFFLSDVASKDGEHPFYWKVTKGHPSFATNPLFRENSERNETSDSAHRTFANYTDHVDSFTPIKLASIQRVIENVEKISRIRLHSVTEPSREDYPDLQNVQILAFQRIVAFHDFLEDHVDKNRFWRAHRRPAWCKDIMLFQVEDRGLESPLL